MRSLRQARVSLIEAFVHALVRGGRKAPSIQEQAELAAFFYLKQLGCTVVARNWKSGRSPGDIDLIAWDGDTLCFIDVGTSTLQSASGNAGSGRNPGRLLRVLADDYISKAGHLTAPPRFDLIIVDLRQDAETHVSRMLKRRSARPEIEYLRGEL